MLKHFALLLGLCVISTALTSQTLTNSKKYFFTVNGGLLGGQAFGYTFGASAGLRFGEILSASVNFQKTISDDHLIKMDNQVYDRFNALMYSLKGYIDISKTNKGRIYGALGGGFSTTPHTKGKDKASNTGQSIGYYQSYFINPGAGIEFPSNKAITWFLELNYNFHQWTNIHGENPDMGSYARKNAQVVYLSIGLKLF